MPVIDIQPKVLESWIRSRNAGIKPGQANKTLISGWELRERILLRKNFYDTAFSVLAGIYRFTIGSGFISAIFDEDGYVLSVSGDEEIMRMAKANALTEGCNRNENNLGTNGIGTALIIGDAIQVSGEEHYFPMHYNWICSGAPVFDPLGQVIGGISIIGTCEKVSFHTLGMVSAAAKAVTQLMLMQDAYEELNRAQQSLVTMISAWPSGLMLVDKNMDIIRVNRGAAHLLGKQTEQMEGHPLKDFMPIDVLNHEDVNAGVSDRPIDLKVNGKPVRFSLTIENTDAKDYVFFFEKLENLHKRVNRIIGSDAEFMLDDIIGESPAMLEATRMARLAAQNNASVFLKGESGTGKEMFAQAIHNASDRRDGPFVAINCGAIPKSLIESELFGYEGGSFTGAKRDGCPGKFELANGGTIFLDEIGDMPFDVQVSLLRVLQNREVSRIGSSKTVKINVRVISATHQNIEQSSIHNQFRSDLYYRLNVFDISIPALRERKGDIAVLAEHFLLKYTGNTRNRIDGFSQKALMAMEEYQWPGNVRELENVVERAVYVSTHGLIQPKSLSFWKRKTEDIYGESRMLQADSATVDENRGMTGPPIPHENERVRVENALYSTGFNVKKAAELLGISRRTIYRKMDIYGISKRDYQK